jgi:hypothetical protein
MIYKCATCLADAIPFIATNDCIVGGDRIVTSHWGMDRMVSAVALLASVHKYQYNKLVDIDKSNKSSLTFQRRAFARNVEVSLVFFGYLNSSQSSAFWCHSSLPIIYIATSWVNHTLYIGMIIVIVMTIVIVKSSHLLDKCPLRPVNSSFQGFKHLFLAIHFSWKLAA